MMWRLIAGVTLALALLQGTAQADVNTVSGVSMPAAVPLTGGTVSVRWTVQRTGPNTGGQPSAVRSNGAELWAGGQLVASFPGTLQRTSTPAVGAPETLIFTESLTVPASAMRVIARANGPAQFRRTFTDTGNLAGVGPYGSAASGQALLSAAGNAQGALSLRRLELAFEDGSRTGVFQPGSMPRAVAEISYMSNGILEAEWRVARADGGGNFERSLGIVRQQLVSAGQGRTRIVSPELPDDMTGLYEVRLIVRQPQLNFDLPRLRYYISAGDTARDIGTLSLIGPDEKVAITEATVFAWQPVAGAQAYQIEIFADKRKPGAPETRTGEAAPEFLLGVFDLETPLVAGKVVPGSSARARLSDASLQYLESGETYRWRVRAIDARGQVMAQSSLRFLTVP